jgi:pimeloyl-ACP methyl ester carboxylesterase
MHIAGADGRQFHGLMIDPRIVKHHGLVSFDLPWHGKSPPPEGAIQGSWRLTPTCMTPSSWASSTPRVWRNPVALRQALLNVICRGP